MSKNAEQFDQVGQEAAQKKTAKVDEALARHQEKAEKRKAKQKLEELEKEFGSNEKKDKKDKKKGGDPKVEKNLLLLKKRDIKKYRKEMRRIKKEAKKNLPESEKVQEDVDPAVLEARKEKKAQVFTKLKEKKKAGDLNSVYTMEGELSANLAELVSKKVVDHLTQKQNDQGLTKEELDKLVTERKQALSKAEGLEDQGLTLFTQEQFASCKNREASLENLIEAIRKKAPSAKAEACVEQSSVHIMAVMQDTQGVVDVYKALVAYCKEHPDQKVALQIQKLFSKHIKPAEQVTLLSKESKAPALNVYVGVPNRMKKLLLMGGYETSSLQFMVIDRRLNKKGLSLLEVRETAADVLDLLTLAAQGSTQIILA